MARPPDAPRELLLLKLLPNLVSILALCSGLTAIRYGIAGNFTLAVLLIGVAAALDGLDGRLARMLKSESAIGAELDSLCDFVNFGVTPALILYMWGLRPETSLGWIAVLVLSPLYLSFATDRALHLSPVLVAAWMVGIGALMISRVRTPSLKRMTIATDHARYVLVGAVIVVAALLTYPWVTLLALCLCYLAGVLWLALGHLMKRKVG